MMQDREIKYLNKDFTDFRDQLISYAKNYFPDTYNDFSVSSPGMMFIEMAAYIGDVLSFYQDTQLQETFLQYAKEPGNLYDLAYMMGYRPKVTNVAEVNITITQNVEALDAGSNYAPNWDQALTLGENTVIKSSTRDEIRFLIDKQVDFGFSSSFDPTVVTVDTIDSQGNPVEYTLSKTVKAISAEIKTITVSVEDAVRFFTYTIEDSNIVGILDIEDGNGNTWYEVPFLGQETIFVEEANQSSDSSKVQKSLQLQKVPRRFVTRFNSSGNLQIQFGSGASLLDDSVITPNPLNVGIGINQGISRIDYAYDPSNFLYTQTYGLAPSNTDLTIRYLVGGGVQANVASGTLTNATYTVSGVDTSFSNTLAFTNITPAAGGKDGDTPEEIRQNAMRAFNEQSRLVSLSDFTVRSLSLPSKYGTIAKVYATQDQLSSTNSTSDVIIDSNPLSLSLYVLAYSNDGTLINATSTLKKNLKNYLAPYLMLTDAVNIKDAFIINIGVNYDILVRPNYNGRDVLTRCTQELQDFFDTAKWSINQPINLSAIYSRLDRIKGVQTVQSVQIVNKVGGTYSQYAYDIPGATRNNIVYPSMDPMIFEVRFPSVDIKGRTTVL